MSFSKRQTIPLTIPNLIQQATVNQRPLLFIWVKHLHYRFAVTVFPLQMSSSVLSLPCYCCHCEWCSPILENVCISETNNWISIQSWLLAVCINAYLFFSAFSLQQDVWYWAMSPSLFYGRNVRLHQLQILRLPSICARAGSAVVACKHRHTCTVTYMLSCFQLYILWFCPQRMCIEQVVIKCDSPGPAEYESGSQTETEKRFWLSSHMHSQLATLYTWNNFKFSVTTVIKRLH